MPTISLALLSLSVCVGLAHWLSHRAESVYAVRTATAQSLCDEENRVSVAEFPYGFYYRYRGRVTVAASFALFFLVSFLHEWAQESYQIYGDIQRLVLEGPPDACHHVDEPSLGLSLLRSIGIHPALQQRADCAQYFESIYRLPLASPGSALLRLCAHLFIHSWSTLGAAVNEFFSQQSFQLKLIAGAAFFFLAVGLANTCVHGVTSAAFSAMSRPSALASFDDRRRPKCIVDLVDDDEPVRRVRFCDTRGAHHCGATPFDGV